MDLGSQFGEDRILISAFKRLKIKKGRSLEFGMKGLKFSNTAHFLNHGWTCKFAEVSVSHYNLLVEDLKDYYPEARWKTVFGEITPENVNSICLPDTNLVSIDIDGNDYYVWEALEQKPELVVIEVSKWRARGVFPYGKENNYKLTKQSGASLDAMIRLGQEKGYRLGALCGINAIFVRDDTDLVLLRGY